MKHRVSIAFVLCVLPCSVRAQEITPALRLDVPNTTLKTFAISPDGATTVQRVSDGVVDSYHVHRAETGVSTELSGPQLPVPATARPSVIFSPDSEWIVYQPGSRTDWYVVPVDLSVTPTRLNGALTPGGQGLSLFFSPDSSRAVYVADQDTDDVFEVYSVPLDGSSAPVKLNGAIVPGGGGVSISTTAVLFTPDSQAVIYHAAQDSASELEMYRVPLEGGSTPVKINPPLVPGGRTGYRPTVVSPDGEYVVYHATLSSPNTDELYSARLDGSAPQVKLSDTWGGIAAATREAWISPDSSFVTYRQYNTNGKEALFSVPITGGPIKAQAVYRDTILDVQITADSQRVFWIEDDSEISSGALTGVLNLWSVPIDERFTSSVLLDHCYWVLSAPRITARLTPDGTSVVYNSYECGRSVWNSSMLGTGKTRLSSGPPREARNLQLPAGGGRAYFLELDENYADITLYGSPLDGSQAATQLSPSPTGTNRGVSAYLVSQNGRGIVYSADDGAQIALWQVYLAVGVDRVAPATGSAQGGTQVVVLGTGFSPTSQVWFGSQRATWTQFIDETTLRAVTPRAPASVPRGKALPVRQRVDVRVQDVGTQATLEGAFQYRVPLGTR